MADKIISRYCRMSATTGSDCSDRGHPGIGTALAMVGGGLADASISMKLQVDMTMLAEAYGWDVNGEDARHLAFLIAAGGSLEKLGVEASTRIASNAGVKMVRQYLKGAVLQALGTLQEDRHHLYPQGAGKSHSVRHRSRHRLRANYALTKYVGNTARSWFEADAALGNKPNEI